MDRGTRPPGIASRLSEQEVLDRAATEADLLGILHANGWRAVRGEDAHARRVLTDSDGSRRIVVSRDPETHRWQWWDTAVEVVSNIVDALKQLVGCRSMRDVIALLRRALNDPPEPLPVSEAPDRHTASTRLTPHILVEQSIPLEEPDHELLPRVPPPDQAADDTLSEIGADDSDESIASDVETVGDQASQTENGSAVEAPEDTVSKLPRKGPRGR